MLKIFQKQRKYLIDDSTKSMQSLAHELQARLSRIQTSHAERFEKLARETELFEHLGYYASYHRGYVVPDSDLYVWNGNCGEFKTTTAYLRRVAKELRRPFITVKFQSSVSPWNRSNLIGCVRSEVEIEMPNLVRLAPLYAALELMVSEGMDAVVTKYKYTTVRSYWVRGEYVKPPEATPDFLPPMHPLALNFVENMARDPHWRAVCNLPRR